MDIADLTEEQVQLAIKLAQILSLEDIKESISILSGFDWNLGRVLGSIDLNESTLKREEKKQGKKKQEHEDVQRKAIEEKKHLNEKAKNQRQSQINEIKERNIERQRKSSRDFVHSHIQAQQKIGTLKVQANKFFLSHITQKYHPLLDFAFNDFRTNLQRSFHQKKYLLVYVHIIDTEKYYDQSIQEIMVDKKITNFTNKHCIVYGIIGGSEDYENIKEYFPQKVQPIFALFKYDNIHNNEQFVAHYRPKEEQLSFLEWLSISTNISISEKIAEQEKEKKKENMKKQQKRWEYFEDDDYKEEKAKEKKKESKLQEKKAEVNEKPQKPKHQRLFLPESLISEDASSISDKIKDMNIKDEQDKAYEKLEKSYIRKQDLSIVRRQEVKQKEEDLKRRQKDAQNSFKCTSGYCVDIKFRMPNGSIVLHKFDPNDKVEKIFAYVDIFCREHFQQKFNDFDLSTTFSPLVFSEAKGQTIDKALEGEKRITINVKQI